MAEELATLPKVPALPTKGRIGMAEVLGVTEPFIKSKAELQPKIREAEGEVLQAKQAQAETLAGGKLAAQEKYGEEEKAARQAYEGKLEAEPLPAFVPTKDTMQDIAGLFSVISVIGALVGGSGKMAAQRAMGAMNGMMEGYRKGRADLYKQERNQFDANFKSMIQKHTEFRKEMEDAVKLAATNKEAGQAAAELAAAKAGSPIIQAMVRQGRLVDAYKTMDESQKGVNDAVKMEQKARAEEAKAEQHRADMAQRERQQRETMAQRERLATIKADAKTAGGAGALPKDTKTNDEHRFRHSAMVTVQEVLDDLQDPEIRRLIGPQNQYMPDVLLNLQNKYPQVAQKLARFQSQEFQIGGKALTSSEQKILNPIYGWRGLTAKALEDNLTEAERTMDKEQRYLENRYPGLQQFTYENPSVKPITVANKADAEALGWANAHPNDPRSAEIKKRLGVQ
jgi:hypothetical protein